MHLCADNITTGKEYPKGSTKTLLELTSLQDTSLTIKN
jgi:hypothetical protein